MDTSVANNGEFVVTPRQYNRYAIIFGDAEYRGEAPASNQTPDVSPY